MWPRGGLSGLTDSKVFNPKSRVKRVFTDIPSLRARMILCQGLEAEDWGTSDAQGMLVPARKSFELNQRPYRTYVSMMNAGG